MQLQIKHEKRVTKNKKSEWKRFEKIKALAHDFFSGFIYFFIIILQEEHVFSSETFRLFWGKNNVLIEIKTRGKRKWRLSSSGYDVVKCKHGEELGMWICRKVKDLLFRNVYSSENIFFFFWLKSPQRIPIEA